MDSVLGFFRPGPAELILIIFIMFIVLVFTAIKVFSFCRIFSKMGYSWAFGLLTKKLGTVTNGMKISVNVL